MSSPASASPLPSRDDLRALLLAGSYDAVERLFQGLQVAQAAGTLTEQEVTRAYDVASCYRGELTPALQGWAAAFPKSYPAQLALGVHLFGQGIKLRTMRRAKDIPEEHLEGLAGAVGAADHQLLHAQGMDRRGALARSYRIGLQTLHGVRAWTEYEQGLERAPDSLGLRRAMLRNLRTEWGGSQDLQDHFLERPEHALLPAPAQAELRAAHLYQRAHYLANFAYDAPGARAAYVQSIETHPLAEALSGLADLSGPLAKRRLHDRALALSPHNDHIRASRAAGRMETWAPAGPELRILEDCAAWGEAFASDYLTAPRWAMRLRPLLAKLVQRQG